MTGIESGTQFPYPSVWNPVEQYTVVGGLD